MITADKAGEILTRMKKTVTEQEVTEFLLFTTQAIRQQIRQHIAKEGINNETTKELQS